MRTLLMASSMSHMTVNHTCTSAQSLLAQQLLVRLLMCITDTHVLLAGGEPVEINAGDFVHFPAGQTTFKVTKPVRKFFTLLD